MTLDEALNVLEPKLLFSPEFNEAISVVKDAMNQYRAIGTIKGYKRTIEVSKENYRMYLEYKAKVKTYETIGTPEECREAVEKQKAKKIVRVKLRQSEWGSEYRCPVCESDLIKTVFFNEDGTEPDEKISWCSGCGQKLDWSDEE